MHLLHACLGNWFAYACFSWKLAVDWKIWKPGMYCRIMNDANMGHSYDGLLWTLRYQIFMFFSNSLDLFPSSVSSYVSFFLYLKEFARTLVCITASRFKGWDSIQFFHEWGICFLPFFLIYLFSATFGFFAFFVLEFEIYPHYLLEMCKS